MSRSGVAEPETSCVWDLARQGAQGHDVHPRMVADLRPPYGGSEPNAFCFHASGPRHSHLALILGSGYEWRIDVMLIRSTVVSALAAVLGAVGLLWLVTGMLLGGGDRTPDLGGPVRFEVPTVAPAVSPPAGSPPAALQPTDEPPAAPSVPPTSREAVPVAPAPQRADEDDDSGRPSDDGRPGNEGGDPDDDSDGGDDGDDDSDDDDDGDDDD